MTVNDMFNKSRITEKETQEVRKQKHADRSEMLDRIKKMKL